MRCGIQNVAHYGLLWTTTLDEPAFFQVHTHMFTPGKPRKYWLEPRYEIWSFANIPAHVEMQKHPLWELFVTDYKQNIRNHMWYRNEDIHDSMMSVEQFCKLPATSQGYMTRRPFLMQMLVKNPHVIDWGCQWLYKNPGLDALLPAYIESKTKLSVNSIIMLCEGNMDQYPLFTLHVANKRWAIDHPNILKFNVACQIPDILQYVKKNAKHLGVSHFTCMALSPNPEVALVVDHCLEYIDICIAKKTTDKYRAQVLLQYILCNQHSTERSIRHCVNKWMSLGLSHLAVYVLCCHHPSMKQTIEKWIGSAFECLKKSFLFEIFLTDKHIPHESRIMWLKFVNKDFENVWTDVVSGYHYDQIKERCDIIRTDLLAAVWHPKRRALWPSTD